MEVSKRCFMVSITIIVACPMRTAELPGHVAFLQMAVQAHSTFCIDLERSLKTDELVGSSESSSCNRERNDWMGVDTSLEERGLILNTDKNQQGSGSQTTVNHRVTILTHIAGIEPHPR
jgi:hypothetical protein